MNLTEDERLKIRLEEAYRAEVIHDINSAKRSRPSFWVLLNSPFFLWVLSSIVLTLLTSSYSSWSEATKRRSDEIILLNRLIADSRARIDKMRVNAAIVRGDVPNTSGSFNIIIGSDGIYPEFKERDFRSVCAEIAAMCTNQPQVHVLTKISNELVALETREDKEAAIAAGPLIDNASVTLDELAGLTSRCSRHR